MIPWYLIFVVFTILSGCTTVNHYVTVDVSDSQVSVELFTLEKGIADKSTPDLAILPKPNGGGRTPPPREK